MKKIVLIFVFVLCFCLLLSGCGKESGEETAAVTTEEVTTAPETEVSLNTEPKQTAIVVNPNWGFPVHAIRVLDETVVTAELEQMGNVLITSYNPGETEVHVLDCFEHKAVIKVKVADDAECTITYEANPCEEEFVIPPGGSWQKSLIFD